MLDVILLCRLASEAGHQEEAHGQVGSSEECGSSSDRAMDAGQPVQWQCLCVEPRNTGTIGKIT